MFNVLAGKLVGWCIEGQMLEVADAWHEMNREQICQTKDGFRLSLGIGMERVRTNLTTIL